MFWRDRAMQQSRQQLRLGGRSDWRPSRRDLLTVQMDAYRGELASNFTLPTLQPPYVEREPGGGPISGGNAIARWTRRFSAESELTLQGYYDRSDRTRP